MRLSPIPAVLASGLFAAILTSHAAAQVSVSGDVKPFDDPRTFGTGDTGNEGLPINGNLPDFFFSDADGNQTDVNGETGQPFYERNRNVVVGENSQGQVEISGGAALRYGHLVLGGSADFEVNAAGTELNSITAAELMEPAGAGFLTITGFGSVYNNHPRIVPTVFQDGGNAEDTFFDVPNAWEFSSGVVYDAGTIERATGAMEIGFDAYVGLTGQGVLEILDGGLAEIQDAVVVGYGPQASGTVRVSGAGSTLINYGGINPASDTTSIFATPSISQMVVGGFGTGVMTIEDGGTVQALRGAAIGVTTSGGEHIGSIDSDDFDRGGRGTVTVDGAGSRWDIYVGQGLIGSSSGDGAEESALAIGEFKEEEDPMTLEPVYDNVVGGAAAGQGELLISNGGLVRLLDADENADDGDLRIGRFGTVTLDSGSLEVADDVFSDGVIAGHGDILAGRFVNRSLGEVRVGGGETLSLRTDQDPGQSLTVGDPDVTLDAALNFFAGNFGSLQVIGDEANGVAEFVYNRTDDPADILASEVRFWNARRTSGAGNSEAGEIIVNNGHLRFRAGPSLDDAADGLRNDGVLAFVGGDNLVTGTIDNTVEGEIYITGSSSGGDNTAVTLADGLVNNGTYIVTDAEVELLPGSAAYSGAGNTALVGGSVMTVAGDFELGDGTAGGALELTTTGSGTPLLIVGGDFTFDAGASLSLDGVLPPTLTAGDTLTLINVFGGTNDLETNFDALDTPSLPSFADPDLVSVLAVDGGGNLVLEVASLSASAASGADFTGDGAIDSEDVDIFATFFGLESGGSVLTGDANGDGAVNALDFILIKEGFAGATFPALASATVPEPTGVALLLLGAAGAASGRRRR